MLVLLAGVPGSGKSTLARRMAPLLPAAIIESDAVRRDLIERPTYTRAESARIFAAIHAATAQLLDNGRSVMLDATNTRAEDRAPVIDVARATRARLFIVHVTAPEDIVLDRLARRQAEPDPRDVSEAGEDVYRRMAAQFERIREPHLRLDTSEDLDEAVARLLQAIRRGNVTG